MYININDNIFKIKYLINKLIKNRKVKFEFINKNVKMLTLNNI